MDLCKNCLKPINESQVYCSTKCWQEYKGKKESTKSPFADLSFSQWVWAQAYSWISIIGMMFSLFFIIILVGSFTDVFHYQILISTAVLSVFVYLVLRYIHDSEKLSQLLAFPKTMETWKLIGFALVVDLFVVKPLNIVFMLEFFPDAQEQEVITALQEMSLLSSIITAFSVSILTPILEELLFRGFILGMFLKCYDNKVAILFSAIIFAIVHEPIAIAMAFGIGLIYGWLRVRTGSIIPSMILHAIWNSFVSILILF